MDRCFCYGARSYGSEPYGCDAEEAVPDNEATESVEENSEEPVYAAMGMSLPEPEVQKPVTAALCRNLSETAMWT